jgi:hypothetical protein
MPDFPEKPAGTGIAGDRVEAVGEGGLLGISAILSFETGLSPSTSASSVNQK